MKHRREYDAALIGRNLKRLRIKKGLSVEAVREYLCLGSVQAIYKYEAGQSYPQTDTLLALMELYEADFRELLWEQITHCRFSGEGCWVLSAAQEDWPEFLLEVMAERHPVKKDQLIVSLFL